MVGSLPKILQYNLILAKSSYFVGPKHPLSHTLKNILSLIASPSLLFYDLHLNLGLCLYVSMYISIFYKYMYLSVDLTIMLPSFFFMCFKG